jgi:hypothetical protein
MLTLWLGSIGIDILTGHNLMWYIVPGTSLWAAIDSSKIQLKRYRHGVGPVLFFFLCCWWWVIGFPWYLWMRNKILTGAAELKTDDPRCVRCEELISADAIDCPKCGWRQPK